MAKSRASCFIAGYWCEPKKVHAWRAPLGTHTIVADCTDWKLDANIFGGGLVMLIKDRLRIIREEKKIPAIDPERKGGISRTRISRIRKW